MVRAAGRIARVHVEGQGGGSSLGGIALVTREKKLLILKSIINWEQNLPGPRLPTFRYPCMTSTLASMVTIDLIDEGDSLACGGRRESRDT